MPGRIVTLQREVRELGRLRAGLTETRRKDGKEITYPTSSKTWILTAANRDYLDAAAQLWGGQVGEWQPQGNGPKAWRLITNTAVVNAILPPGDPLSQHQEMWSRGGCQRRCDGERELLTQQPCLCRAQHGDDFHEQKQGTVCDIHTRLNVFLPDLPDIGVWRMETKGFWPANHIAGYVDLIKGRVGPMAMVPVWLGIEQRTKVKAGKTSQYIEIVIGLRSTASFAEIISSPAVATIGSGPDPQALSAGPQVPAIAAGPAVDYMALANEATDPDAVRTLWKQAHGAGQLTEALAAHLEARVAALQPAALVRAVETAEAPEPDAEPGDQGASWLNAIGAATDVPALRALWEQGAKDAGNDVKNAWWTRKKALDSGTAAAPAPRAEPVDAEVEPDKDLTWTLVLTAAAAKGWNTPTTTAKFADIMGKEIADADGWTIALFLDGVKSGEIQ